MVMLKGSSMAIDRCTSHQSPAIKQTFIRDGDAEARVLNEEPIQGIFAAPVGATITIAYIGCACIDRLKIVGGD